MKQQVHVKNEEEGTDYTYTPIECVPISPELMSIKPFIVPAKGFSYNEVLSMIQKLINRAKGE